MADLLICKPQESYREAWCRVHRINHEGRVSTSELSWPLARRILPLLCERHGITGDAQAGLFAGSIIRIPERSEA